jgi:hypothetical protein
VTAKAAKTRESGSQRPGKTNDSNRYGAWSPWSSHPGFVVPNLIKVRDGEAPSPAREARALPGTLRHALATARLQDKRIRKPENQERLTNQTVTQLGHLGHLILVSWFPNLIQVRAGEAPSLRQLPDEGVLPGTITAPPTRKKARRRFRCRPTDSGGADFRRRRAGYRRDSRSAVRSPGCR